jgi:hypothetical protein
MQHVRNNYLFYATLFERKHLRCELVATYRKSSSSWGSSMIQLL